MSIVETMNETLVINPAFLQEIKDSNPECWDTQHRLRQLCHCDSDPADRLNRLVKLLGAFRDHLALQFALEESYGYQKVRGINTTAKVLLNPGLIDKAHDQHCTLYLEITALSEAANELQYRGLETGQLEKLIQQVCDFDAKLIQHETLESDLIEQSFELS
ncbi:hypothetical protein K239x_30850 [Planctomycetes bacterium K23_9]|uniref:Hemerythrin-like domain-containing protein n=2 Tax=Stieleria marina TaxID=1930275 RepID=A0A517NVD7_9BACT|nr:hypothetical protein K239x_30850 [Planctomycetes bacterium K23_9]